MKKAYILSGAIALVIIGSGAGLYYYGTQHPQNKEVSSSDIVEAPNDGTTNEDNTDDQGTDTTNEATEGSSPQDDGTTQDANEPSQETKDEVKKPSLEGTAVEKDGQLVVTNLSDILILVNKDRVLPADYVPEDLVEPNVTFSFDEKLPKRLMRKEAAEALEQMFAKAKEDNIDLVAQSGFRSYQTQDAIFASNIKKYGSKEEANKVSAVPGQSEHQTGLTMDVTSRSLNFTLEEEFAQTDEGKWIAEHCAEFGFIIRFPKGKEDITKYSYEPWHIRYVGKDAAKEIMEKGITLEEYFQQ